ncbi:unannotated protein [freshwater metagenome]|uniref:Unannotated protein n=1 Tax=freshwater metagenome TaxID=449393 RepID=A0A6J7ELJ6_9ZZZZ|nr:hypothetical protein [Actinomycetota bacterium]
MSKQEITAHLKKFDKPQRDALQAVREMIAEALPEADQVIKYGIPTFAIEGKGIIGFDGFKNHNSIFPYSGSLAGRLKDELSNYEQTKGSIHFDKVKPFPKGLLKKIIKERLIQMREK